MGRLEAKKDALRPTVSAKNYPIDAGPDLDMKTPHGKFLPKFEIVYLNISTVALEGNAVRGND